MALIRSRVLGEGVSSIVFKAVPVAIQRGNEGVRAVKSSLMFSTLQKEEAILKSFIGCTEIVQCYESQITVENGLLIYNLIMEFAPHGSLANQIKSKPFVEDEVKIYTRMILRGLSCIHRKNIVHCDLKPENILVFPSSQPAASYQLKIADFGLSKTKEENTNANYWRFKFRGTPFYMSPESLALGQIEAPLDIWSLGCIVIEMITGFPAWWKLATAEDIMFEVAIMKQAPEIPNGVSQDCRDFLHKCLAVDPRGRWTADMLLNHPFILSHCPIIS